MVQDPMGRAEARSRAKRLAFHGLGETERERLRSLRGLLEPQLDAIIDAFYEHLLSHASSREILERHANLERLRRRQRAYFLGLLDARFDEAFFESRRQVGLVHHALGVAPEIYLGAYQRFLEFSLAAIAPSLSGELDELRSAMSALSRAIHLDMSVTLDAWFARGREELADKGRELERANRELIETQDQRRRLTDMIVHDLRNPLAGVQAGLETLKLDEERLDAHGRFVVDESIARCRELQSMISNVLEISRAESGALRVALARFGLHRLAEERAGAFALTAERRGSRVGFHAREAFLVRADHELTSRILDNLLRNAIRHTPAGTSVTVSTRILPDGRARLSVTDDGPGIVPDALPLLFEPAAGQALHEVGVRVDSGLGLPFCRMAAEAMGALIMAESDGVTGTAFHLDFPPDVVSPLSAEG